MHSAWRPSSPVQVLSLPRRWIPSTITVACWVSVVTHIFIAWFWPASHLKLLQYAAANVIGEAEWRSEANRCEGIRIDTDTDSFSSPPQSAAVSKSDRVSDSDEDAPPPNILYDGVISDFESTHHGMLSCHIEPVASHEDNTVHPDTILRQMILHEIHSDGMGPDWEYQDSLELLLGRCSAFLFEITSPIICQQY